MIKRSDISPNIAIFGITGFVFVLAKIFGVIDWSWPWVVAPFVIGIVIEFAIYMFMVFIEGQKED